MADVAQVAAAEAPDSPAPLPVPIPNSIFIAAPSSASSVPEFIVVPTMDTPTSGNAQVSQNSDFSISTTSPTPAGTATPMHVHNVDGGADADAGVETGATATATLAHFADDRDDDDDNTSNLLLAVEHELEEHTEDPRTRDIAAPVVPPEANEDRQADPTGDMAESPTAETSTAVTTTDDDTDLALLPFAGEDEVEVTVGSTSAAVEEEEEMLLPFADEDEVDLGTPFDGVFTSYSAPPADSVFPYHDVEEEDEFKQLLHNANLASFYQTNGGHDFYRNYIRGDTMRRLRSPVKVTSGEGVESTVKPLQGKPGALAGLLHLPNELLIDVMEMFHPLDLLHLSRSSKALRAVVLDKKIGKRVWDSAYENHPEVLAPPEEVCAPKWTAMMYADAVCDFCGSEGALMDIALEERYCDTCHYKYLGDQSDLSDMVENVSDRVREYLFQVLPYSYRSGGSKYQSHYETESNARYRKKDVSKMIETLTAWFMTIDEGAFPDASDKFKEWAKELTDKAQTVSDYAQNFNNWAMSYYYTLNSHVMELQRKVANQLLAKLAKKGHDSRDTEKAQHDVYYVVRGAEITRANPKKLLAILPEVITKIEHQKKMRMKDDRRKIVEEFYLDYHRTMKAERWANLPPGDVLAYHPFFSAYTDQDTLDMGESLKVEEGKALVPDLISDWLFDRQKELYETLPGVTPVDEAEDVITDEEKKDLSPEEIEAKLTVLRKARRAAEQKVMLERLQLAKSVFTCLSCKASRHVGLAVVGWDDACVHMCGTFQTYYHMGWEFCSVGYATAGALVERVGLDRDTARPEDMDKVDARFFCGNCPVKTKGKVHGRKAMTWRECVTHAVEKEEDHTHAIPAWLLLSPEAESFTKSHEAPFPSHRKTAWSCNHCSEHLEKPVVFKDACAHVTKAHEIEKPVVDVDVVFLKGQYEKKHMSRRRKIFQYGVEPTANLRCELCRFGSVRKMWTIQALVPHLFHKHGISMPRSTRDYTKVEILAN